MISYTMIRFFYLHTYLMLHKLIFHIQIYLNSWLDTNFLKQWECCFLISPQLCANSSKCLFRPLNFIHMTAGILCLSVGSVSPHTHFKPGTTVESPLTSTIKDSWRMTHNAVQPCLQRGRLPIFPLFFLPPSLPTPPCPHPLSLQTS